MNRPSGNDYRIQTRPRPSSQPFDDEGPPPVELVDVGHTLWKVAQVGMGAFAGNLTGLFVGSTTGALMGAILGSEWDALGWGYLGGIFGWIVGGLVFGILVWRDLS